MASTGTRPAPSGRWRAGNIIGLILCLILGPGLGTVLIVGSVLEHGDAAQTSYTQAHGIRRAARVFSEDTSTGRDPYSAVAVRLSGPVNGHETTTVHIQGAPTYSPGAPVTVVVDPQDPGYAELPGAPYTSSAQWESTGDRAGRHRGLPDRRRRRRPATVAQSASAESVLAALTGPQQKPHLLSVAIMKLCRNTRSMFY
jgi:hypothetical protein